MSAVKLDLRLGKNYEIEIKNRDGTRSTLVATFIGRKSDGRYNFRYGAGQETGANKVVRRIFWYTDHGSTITASIAIVISLVSLAISILTYMRDMK
jgi:hypothetical protein